MTPDEHKQVQNFLNIRTKLLNEMISQQEQKIHSLTEQLDDKDREISGLKTQLAQAQEQTASLKSALESLKAQPTVILPSPQPEPPKPQKPSYLVSLLRQHFSYDSFRPGQEEVIDAILTGRDVLCSMPENYGMSLCYRLPALLMPGLTLVISQDTPDNPKPDQHCDILTSSTSPTKKRDILRRVKNGVCKILVSPLGLLTSAEITAALKNTEISMAVIREGSDLKASCEFIDSLSAKRISRGVFTGPTNPTERQDIMKSLRSPARVCAGFVRPEVSFTVIRTERKASAVSDILSRRTGQPGVIYCSSPEAAYKLRETLRDYDGLGDTLTILPGILYHQVEREDIRFVVHYDFPKDLPEYSREINCANSECIILASRKDLREADKSIAQFCTDEDKAEFLRSYLGMDEKFSQPAQAKIDEIAPEDFSDFDFGTANESQKEAITNITGPLLIIAGPGTGKTYTLIQRAVFLIQKKRVLPSSIMLATFTDRAASELQTRITEELSARKIVADVSAMYTGTFHVICARILREYADFSPHGKDFRILDDFGHAYMILQNMNKFLDIPGIESIFRTSGKWRRSQELRDYINALSEELIDPEELERNIDPAVSALAKAMKLHASMLRENNSMSYSSLLTETYKLLRDNPEILESLQSKISYIMIDEYQDTNYVQEQLIFLLGNESRNVCVVGDDDQSLYRFRGATVRNILEFPDKWAKNECRIVKLMLNYRSSPAIVNFSSRWMDDTENFFSWGNFRHEKKLEAHKPEPSYPSVMRLAGINDKDGWHEKILAFIKSLKDSGILTDYSQTAFLFRSVKAQRVQELAHYLENNNINVYSPRSNLFFTRPEILFAIGCLLSMFPDYLKSLNAGEFSYQGREPDYITYYKNCLKNLSRYIDKPAYSDLKDWLLKRRDDHRKLKGYAGYKYTDLLYELFAFEPFRHALDADVSGSVKALRPARNLARLMQVFRDYEHSYNVNNIKGEYMNTQFTMMMNIYVKFRIDEGLDEYESDTESVPPGHVAFMTIHQAKGREFPVVFVDSLWSRPDSDLVKDRNNELIREILHDYSRRGDFESAESIRLFDFWRLYYVAFTRAQNLLILTCNEDGRTPSTYLEGAYNGLDDADEIFTPSPEIELTPQKDSDLRNTYSFTRDILVYESCPMQYKFLRELEFSPAIAASTFLGTLVHATLEDIHRAVLNQEEHKINEANISEWFSENYELLSRREQAYLSPQAQETAFAQVMNYVMRQGSDWTGLVAAESELRVVREKYILEGRIDLIRIRDGETEIIDFKSGAKPNININSDRERLDTYLRQVNVYAYLAEKVLGLKVDRMTLYYTGEGGNSPEMSYTFDEGEAEKFVKGFDNTAEKILMKDFEHRTENLDTCRECPFKYYCGRA